jgi:predicted DNA-binding ribbon-helix-helix protein
MKPLQSPHMRFVRVNGRRTSITVEAEFWDEFKLIAFRNRSTLDAMLSHIDRTMRLLPKQRPGRHRVLNLSAAVRIFVLRDVVSRVPEQESSAFRQMPRAIPHSSRERRSYPTDPHRA